MLIITKENIIDYLKKHMPDFDDAQPVTVSQIGEGSEEEDGDGYVNYIFRVQTPKEAYVLKQGRELARVAQEPMDLSRIELEYKYMKIRCAIVPEYTPFLKFLDRENHIFVMEDVSRLKISRFQFDKNVIFPSFGRQCGECMARMEFFTSEYFLDRTQYRGLQEAFDNTAMRRIMEDGLFMDRFGCETFDQSLGRDFEAFAARLSNDERFVTERFKLRRSYMSHADALIHADFHTSNVFASADEMKVIDGEFAFMGPFGYDLGYMAGSLLSQYCAACFKPFSSEEERRQFKAYLLASIKCMFETYRQTFAGCWSRGKKRYQGQKGLLDSILAGVLFEAPGYASIVNWFRTASPIAYPDFDVIEDGEAKRRAKTLSLLMDWNIMFDRYRYRSVDDFLETVLATEESYREIIK